MQPRPHMQPVPRRPHADGNPTEQDPVPAVPSPEIRASIQALRSEWGGGATWGQAEILTLSGAAPHWLDRWKVLWQILRDNKLDSANQEYRLRMAAELAADMIGSPSPEKSDRYESLRQDCMPPAPSLTLRADLWATCSNTGLLMLLGQSDDMFRLLEDQAPYALPQIPSGRFAVVRLEAAVEIARDQAPYWAWAAAKAGVLYGVEPIPPKPV